MTRLNGVTVPVDTWPDPKPIGEWRLAPVFPVAVLPPSLAEWVRATSEATQTPPDLAAGMALAALSTAALGLAEVECAPGWREELALWLVVTLPSGERKSTVQRSAVAPLVELERELLADARPALAKARAEREALEARRRALVVLVAKGKADPEELAEVAERLEATPEPVAPRMFADDATPEALAGLLARHGAIGVLSAESAFLDNLAGRYSDGQANLHLALQAYSGEATRVDRRGREPEHLERPLLALGLAVQPHVLQRLSHHEDMRDQGLLARACVLAPASAIGRRVLDPLPVPEQVRATYGHVLKRLARARLTADRTDTTGSVGSVGTSQVLRLTPEAASSFRELRADHEPRLSPDGGDLAPILTWANRHPGRVARIAGLLHLAEHDTHEPIGESTMRAAVSIGECLVEHARLLLSEPSGRLTRALEALAGRARITVRELHRDALNARGPAEDAARLAEQLADLGYLRRLPPPPPNPTGGRPPSAAYAVHPRLREGER